MENIIYNELLARGDSVDVGGVAKDAKASCTLLDNQHDLEPHAVEFKEFLSVLLPFAGNGLHPDHSGQFFTKVLFSPGI